MGRAIKTDIHSPEIISYLTLEGVLLGLFEVFISLEGQIEFLGEYNFSEFELNNTYITWLCVIFFLEPVTPWFQPILAGLLEALVRILLSDIDHSSFSETLCICYPNL